MGLISHVLGQVDTKIHYDEADETITIERIQDCDAILASNRARENAFDHSSYLRHDMIPIATIPNIIIERWMKLYGKDVLDDDKLVKRLLNDKDWRYLRTAPGCI